MPNSWIFVVLANEPKNIAQFAGQCLQLKTFPPFVSRSLIQGDPLSHNWFKCWFLLCTIKWSLWNTACLSGLRVPGCTKPIYFLLFCLRHLTMCFNDSSAVLGAPPLMGKNRPSLSKHSLFSSSHQNNSVLPHDCAAEHGKQPHKTPFRPEAGPWGDGSAQQWVILKKNSVSASVGQCRLLGKNNPAHLKTH